MSGKATREEMMEARLPLAFRDNCAKYLITLNKCRRENYYLPFRCVDERHTYEKCQHEEYEKRVEKLKNKN
eukprot:maker-scaffold_12-snap-gene-3.16-mRNA-1 protein AED:0.01 eAED:0.01 QI:110/1/1/1/1/1/2/692/70